MQTVNTSDIAHFFVAGINYKKTEASVRGQFAISGEQQAAILIRAKEIGVPEVFILSTCNRTEIYGFAQNADQLIDLLCLYTDGSRELFQQMAYIKSGSQAILHLFQVGAGLDSQILGDYEIVGQIKSATKIAKKYSCIGAFTERLVNAVLQSSKLIKNQTALSGGTVSVSFAAVQFIKQKFKKVSGKKILLIGTGKIGRNTCKNLVDYLHAENITLINRSEDSAIQLASELKLKHAALPELKNYLDDSDIILVATNSPEPVIKFGDLSDTGPKLIIDLSIPCNVDASVSRLQNITLVNVDELSKLKDETLQKREAEIPAVKAIIQEQLESFMEWHQLRKHVPFLKAVKLKLLEIHTDPYYLHQNCSILVSTENHQHNIQKVLNGMAVKMRRQNQYGCHYIEAINEYLTTG